MSGIFTTSYRQKSVRGDRVPHIKWKIPRVSFLGFFLINIGFLIVKYIMQL